MTDPTKPPAPIVNGFLPLEDEPIGPDSFPGEDAPHAPAIKPPAAPLPPRPAPAPQRVTAPPAPAKDGTRRGRPKGASTLPKTPPTPKAPKASPFSGAVAGDGQGNIDFSKAGVAAEIAALPAPQLAAVVVTVGEGVCVALAGMRYGPEIAKEVFALSRQERDVLEPLTCEWVKTALPKVTAGELLLVMLFVTMGQKIVVAEQRQDALKSKQPKHPPPREAPTAPAAVV